MLNLYFVTYLCYCSTYIKKDKSIMKIVLLNALTISSMNVNYENCAVECIDNIIKECELQNMLAPHK